MKVALYWLFLVVNLSASSFAMQLPIERSIKIIVGGDMEKITLERMFQEIPTKPGAEYKFVEQLIDETLLKITPDDCTYILYAIDYSKFENPQSHEKVVPILREVRKIFPRNGFPLNIVLTNVNTVHRGVADAKIIEYFWDRGISLFLNNVFIIPEKFDGEKSTSKDKLVELQMLKNNMFIWGQ